MDINPKWSLNVGKDKTTDELWLVLSDMDSTKQIEIAMFADDTRMKLFVAWMETQGYRSTSLPNTDELDKFFE